MLAKFRTAGLVWPTLFAIPTLALLIGLGNWQMSRKAWKEGLLAQIASLVKASPRPLSPSPSDPPWGPGEPREYQPVRLTGTFVHTAERHVYAPRPGEPGWLVFTPLALANSPEAAFVLVNRGWVPDHLRLPSTRAAGLVEGPVRVDGLYRLPERPGTFTPANAPDRNTWYWRDVPAMLAGLPCSGSDSCLKTAYIDALAEPATPGGWPRGGTTNLVIPNRHLEYALTWYALAATLVGMWIAFVVSRIRRPS